MISKPFIECKYCGFNDHHSDHCESSTLGVKYVDYLKRSVWYLDSGCSRHMTWIKQYLHRYSKESSPKVVFGDDSSGDTEGYGSVNCNGITFTRVAYVNGLKHNLINISQLCDANYKVLFTKTQGTIYSQNNEVVLIAPRRRDAYIIDMSSFNKENNACFFAKASPSINWLWHKKMENLNEVRVKELRSNNGTKFRNHKLEEFCNEKGRSPDISYFHVFGCPVHIHNHKDHLGKFDEKVDDGFFLGYSSVAKAFRVFNIRRQEMEETVHVTFCEDDEAISQSSTEGDVINFNENRSFSDDEFLKPRSEVTQCPGNTKYFPYIPAYENNTPSESPILQESVISEDPFEFTEADNHPALNEPDQTESANLFELVEPQNNVIIKPISYVQPLPTISPSAEVILQTSVPQERWSREKHIELVNIIGEPLTSITTRSRIRDSDVASAFECLYVNFLFEMEPKKFIEAIEEEGWIISMQEELNQFKRNKIGGHQDIFCLCSLHGFYGVSDGYKSAFLNGKISEEVYVQQPLGFESSKYPNHVCKLDKALYGLKQAPRAWYETLSKFLIQHKFVRGTIDNTLFTYKTKSDVIIIQIYVDDIIIGSTSSKLSKQFGKLMTKKYEISMMGELTYFLGFQIKQDFKGISICQEKYIKDLLKKYDLADCASVKCPMLPPSNLGPDESGVSVNETLYQANPKESHLVAIKRIFRYLKGTLNLSLWYPKGSGFDLKAYSDSDYIRCNMDRKSTSGGCQILGGKLVCWSVKKQSSMAMSSAKVDYVAAGCVEEETKTITFLISWWDKPLSFTQVEFISAIGLPICKDIVLLPPKETVRAGLATLGLFDKDKPNLSSTILVNSSPLKMKASVQHVTQSKVTTDLEKKKKKILPSSKPKSPYKVRVILPKKQVTKTQHAEVIVATADATKSLVASELAEDQGNQLSAAEAKKVLDQNVKEENDAEFVAMEEVAEEQSLEFPTVEQVLDEADIINKVIQETPESPYDTESEIKVVKSFLMSHISELQDQTMHDSEEIADIHEDSDSDLQSMPDDDLRSVSGFDTADSDDTHENEVSKSDHIFQDDNAFTERLGLPDHMDHIWEEFSSLHSKLGDMESFILSSFLSDALKDTFPQFLKDSIRSYVLKSIAEELPHVEAQVQKNLQDQLPNLLLKPMYKEFNAFNKLKS
ncbi:retrovirus-related pol polyprotein from transposon TNT 1-94 [Tanacetum coccineum]